MAQNPQQNAMQQPSIIWHEIGKLSKYFKHTLLFSLFTNLLLLAPTWYMLEVYDRVVNSQNQRTLLMLTLLVLVMYGVLEMLEWIRAGILHEA